MLARPELLLVGAVAAVGVLHTIVPDHWVPITLLARQHGWTKREVGRAALIAGTGHTVSTLLIGLVVWVAGVAVATKFGNVVSIASSVALIAFGSWIAISSIREMRPGGGHRHEHAHGVEHGPANGFRQPGREAFTDDGLNLYQPSPVGTTVMTTHRHAHRHGPATTHLHLHDHGPDTAHVVALASASDPPLHHHKHKRSLRTTLLLILGSSPMVEGIPAFFAAGRYGPGLMAVMTVVFALATIATYVLLCVSSVAGLRRVSFGPLERYGEVLSGAFIALVGLVFLIFPVL